MGSGTAKFTSYILSNEAQHFFVQLVYEAMTMIFPYLGENFASETVRNRVALSTSEHSL